MPSGTRSDGLLGLHERKTALNSMMELVAGQPSDCLGPKACGLVTSVCGHRCPHSATSGFINSRVAPLAAVLPSVRHARCAAAGPLLGRPACCHDPRGPRGAREQNPRRCGMLGMVCSRDAMPVGRAAGPAAPCSTPPPPPSSCAAAPLPSSSPPMPPLTGALLCRSRPASAGKDRAAQAEAGVHQLGGLCHRQQCDGLESAGRCVHLVWSIL